MTCQFVLTNLELCSIFKVALEPFELASDFRFQAKSRSAFIVKRPVAAEALSGRDLIPHSGRKNFRKRVSETSISHVE